MKLSEAAAYCALAYSHPNRWFMERKNNSLVIAIRGTQSIIDFIEDLRFTKSVFLGLHAHAGFVDRYSELWPLIADAVSIHDEITITGHSLGGAVATLVGYALKVHRRVDCRVITFGSPRVFDEAGARAYNGAVPNTTRVTHSLDLVPRVPKLDYKHVNQQLHLTDAGRVIGSRETWWRELFHFAAIVKADFDGEALAGHHIPSYIAAVQGYEARG